MRTRTWIIIVVLIALLALGFWWWKRATPYAAEGDKLHLKPKISVASMNVTDIDKDRIKLTSRVMLSNPLPINLSTKRLDYQVFIDSVKVIQSSYDKPINIRSGDSSVIETPMEILAKPLAEVLKYFDEKKIDSADYSVRAQVETDIPVAGEKVFNMEFSKRLPAIRLPPAKAGKIDIDKLGLKQSNLDMVLHVYNPNSFPLKFKDGKYMVTIDKDMKMNGALEKIINLPPKGSQDITISVDVKTAKMGKVVWKMLFNKKDTPYKLNFNGKLLTDNGMLKNSNIAFTMHGTLEDLTELAKEVSK